MAGPLNHTQREREQQTAKEGKYTTRKQNEGGHTLRGNRVRKDGLKNGQGKNTEESKQNKE